MRFSVSQICILHVYYILFYSEKDIELFKDRKTVCFLKINTVNIILFVGVSLWIKVY